MNNEELLKYFNNFNGKAWETKKIVKEIKAKDKVKSHELDLIIGKKLFNASGANKTCAYFGDQKVYAVLKSNTPYVPSYRQQVLDKNNRILGLNRELVNKGLCIPKLYSMFFADSNFIEVYERALGDVVAIAKLKNFVEKNCGITVDYNAVSSSVLQHKIGKAIYDFNLKQQNVMLNLPQEAFNKLFNTFYTLNEMGMRFEDTHSENVMVSNKGFTLVDLNYDKMLQKNNRVNNEELVSNFFDPFSFATCYSKFLTDKQFNELNKNNLKILKKLIDAISSKNLVICDKPLYLFNSAGEVCGVEAFINNFDYLFESQNILRKNLHLPQVDLIKNKNTKTKK